MKTLTHGRQVTIAEGIACVSVRTCASWGMIDHGTQSINATRSGTRVFAFLSDTSFIAGAIRINRTFGTAIRWRSDVIRHARARRIASPVLTRGKRTAGRWDARVDLYRWSRRY